ncbi:MAG: YnbE family lipoprotein [Woeseiaceae bacterium]
MKSILSLFVLLAFLAGCSPTVKVEAPDKPIEINLNVKIEHEIRVQVDKELEGLFEDDSDVF